MRTTSTSATRTETAGTTGYEHRQVGAGVWIWLPTVLILLGLAAMNRDDGGLWGPLLATSAFLSLLGGCFSTLDVRGEGASLRVVFGPIPLFRRQIRYRDIESAVVARSRWIDGWGIHWIPRRGWTYNLWGFSCAELRVSGRAVRIGTDDAPGLVAFLTRRLAAESGDADRGASDPEASAPQE